MPGTIEQAVMLCPGPSLAATLPGLTGGELGPYELSIAVNRAAAAYAADYWSILDWKSFDDVTPLGRPVILIGEKNWTRILRRMPAAADFDVCWIEELTEPPVKRWQSYSATVAALAAWHFGARAIDVYGCDLAGKADWDGAELARQRRDERRWRREGAIWRDLVPWLALQGVRLRLTKPPDVHRGGSGNER